MMIPLIKKMLAAVGISNPSTLALPILQRCIEKAAKEQGLAGDLKILRKLIPDISDQYSGSVVTEGYNEVKVRTLQAFQINLLEKAVRMLNKDKVIVVDIGDSSGNHLTYLKARLKDISLQTISVNLDEKAVGKIRAKGLEALHCRAEDIDLGDESVDIFASFQMVEHLMDPCRFFKRLADKESANMMVVTLPYRAQSSVGLWTYRPMISSLDKDMALPDDPAFLNKTKYAEDEHIFELSPIDWKLLMLFSGWRPIYDEIYLQYPKRHPLRLLKSYWKRFDFEGFWGVILKRDMRFTKIYKDWQI